ncbi:hypothetical protein PQQ52_19795 [Paraburkholderia sediminicola]|uniref:hypothetical protein n=1 Tax=Paraburkholderia sediminicola TaxID=458836 RepID=UPI0038BD28E4
MSIRSFATTDNGEGKMSAMLYELTAHAARICLPVPVPAAAPGGWLEPLIRHIDHWQTLAGNGIGGLMGIAGALIVAVMVRSREQRIAAGMVLPDVQQLAAAGGGMAHWLGSQPNLADAYRHNAAINRLRESRRPLMLALHGPVIGQLSDIDARLYSHLFQCEMVHRAFEDGIAAQQATFAALLNAPFDQSPKVTRTAPGDLQLFDDWLLCVEHATLAAYFLDRFVFSRWPRWVHRLRMKLHPNALDRRSARLITTGELLVQPPPAGATTPAQA